jgi:hypothetical protein
MIVCSIKWRKKTRFLTRNAAGVQGLRPDLCGNKTKQNEKNKTILAFLAMIMMIFFFLFVPSLSWQMIVVLLNTVVGKQCFKRPLSLSVPRDLLGSAG